MSFLSHATGPRETELSMASFSYTSSHFLKATAMHVKLLSRSDLVKTTSFASFHPDSFGVSGWTEVAATPLVMRLWVRLQKGRCWEATHQQDVTFDPQITGRRRWNQGLTLEGLFPDREARAPKEHVYRKQWWRHWGSSVDHLGFWAQKGITCTLVKNYIQQFYSV